MANLSSVPSLDHLEDDAEDDGDDDGPAGEDEEKVSPKPVHLCRSLLPAVYTCRKLSADFLC